MERLALSLPTPSSIAADVVRDALGAIAHAVSSGIVSVAAWAIGGLTHAATATTAINLDTWFQGPWRAMGAVAAVVAVPLFLAGVLSALVRGEGPAGLARVLGRLLAAAAGGVLALAGVELLLALVDFSCAVVEHASGISLAGALARLGTALGVTSAVGGPQIGAIGAAVLALLAALGALVLWLELAVRSALVLVATAFIPLALAGLLWPATASWFRRLAEVLAAVALSKLVIVVVLVLGAAALTASPVSLSAPGADADAVVSGIAFLAVATLGLPMALRLVPMAAEAAMGAGLGAVLVRRGLRAPATVAGHVSAAGSLLNKVNGAGVNGAGAAAAKGGTGTGAAGTSAAVAARFQRASAGSPRGGPTSSTTSPTSDRPPRRGGRAPWDLGDDNR